YLHIHEPLWLWTNHHLPNLPSYTNGTVHQLIEQCPSPKQLHSIDKRGDGRPVGLKLHGLPIIYYI
ncbi:hypothetical protein SAMD00019534_025910, partial [Acytostelium subglobosum LB1]|uniref:hypothetical protein n=1 Tax=Acytostelium subglobosum LB1 TaxID=1410327 RepID=UPI000644BC7A